ncbi:uncharacterized protein LOC113337518 [Papaver somniferum]|uniref:uncharacterized protein LOC113337518 n=1 Tax=Papaver somniferum TaxID=3469 RepID=UPI000E6FB5B5|nr:uncharacterized protein LOC113337518 [Papaver somniferum]
MSSWFDDPKLFICNSDDTASNGFNIYRCSKELNGTIDVSDLEFIGNGLSEHLSLGDKKESDFDALLAYLIDFYVCSGSNIWRIVNCQGLAIIWEQPNCDEVICSWSREPLDSPYYNLLGITPPVDAEKEALKRRVSDLLAEISPLVVEVQRNNEDKNTLINEKKSVEKINSELKARNSTLEADLQREKNEKRDLEKQVSDLKSKLKKGGGGSAGEQPWKSGKGTVPDNWVPFEELDVLNIPRNTSLKMIKASGALKIVEDKTFTTNVHASHFYRGVYLEAVNVEELIPNKHEARFDPAIWYLYKNGGTFYAARKLF